MFNNAILTRSFATLALVAAFAGAMSAQRSSSGGPRQETLLNGMRVLMFSDTAEQVKVRIRVHSGAAFDPQGKEGLMCLLSDAIFPNQASRDFFSDVGGGLEVTCNYDYIEIAASSNQEGFLTMIETLAAAVSTPTLDKEVTAAVKAEAIKRAAELEKQPAYAADIAAASHLLGTFPYGRPANGTPASIDTIDFADLRFAYGRFFGADNATITLSGRYQSENAYRAVRRFFGAWKKSDGRVPSTFRQPDAPETVMKSVPSPVAGTGEVRMIARGISRNSKEYPASLVAAGLIETRLRNATPADKRELVSVANNANILPGTFVIRFSDISRPDNGSKPVEVNEAVPKALGDRISQAEFDAAKRLVLAKRALIEPTTLWLDVHTYSLRSAKAEADAITAVSLADVQSFIDKLRAAPMVSLMLFTPAEETAEN